ncbi:PREDICTED: uncharacterized protein LOC109478620 [Branchiostoma belcheri]|uniref:Uncharacterized protein LOC109478620 n=1 Tax=Branchiostoma belcheri TaxID=7741 RepID=A0A6P5A242_BRABE|nr:PREDICTED: uncharacterized protein LOC109478620 [Branchiostoma belcheri]
MESLKSVLDRFKLCLFGRLVSMRNTILAKKVFLFRLYSYVLARTNRKARGLVSECFEVAREYGLEGWLEEYWLTTNFPSASEWKQLVKTTIRAKENERWQATVSSESTCHRFYKVHPTSEKPHKLWVLARQQPEHQRDLKNLILLSTVPTKHDRKPCPTCMSDTEDLVGHLFTRCTTFIHLRQALAEELVNYLGVRVMARVHEQPEERFTEIMLGAEVTEEEVDAEVWSAFITTAAKLLRPLATMALKHATWKER